MDNLREITREIVNVTNEGTNNYDIFDDVLKILDREFNSESDSEETEDKTKDE